MKTAGMFGENPKRIEFYHHARRYLREHDPIGYETMRHEQIERMADALRYEAFREHAQPYQRIKQKLLGDFYNLQVRPNVPLPEWLTDQLAELDTMIASVAREFGYEPDQPGEKHVP
jgi:hypothetical protein